MDSQMEIATFGGGCFWCTEALFENLKGVVKVESGYSGGQVNNPTYKEVCTGNTGHAEVIQITFDSSLIEYKSLLEVFFKTHDPTTLNRQGNDAGNQYRSVIFWHNEKQRITAEEVKNALNTSGAWDKSIVTEISRLNIFFKAEDNHQNYYNENKNQPYCTYVIQPKLEKFEKVFKDKLK